MKTANLTLKFLLELAAFAAFAYWGSSVGGGGASILLAIATPGAAVLLWGRLAAPRSEHRLPPRARIPLELTLFALAAAALFSGGKELVGVLFTVLVIVNSALLSILRQW